MRFRHAIRLLAVLAVALTSLALAACGGDDDSDDSGSAGSSPSMESSDKAPAGGGSEKLALDAVEKGPQQYGFSPTALTAKSGEVTVTMTNPAGNKAPHAIEVEGNGLEEVGETVQAGGSSTVTADLKPGKYEFYCPVGNHRELGMEGTLTVR